METTQTIEAGQSPAPSPAPGPARSVEARQSIWTLAGGKGGVGRSLLAANLGIQLARTGRRVVLVDLDLQGSNLHGYLGYQRLPRSLADLASGRVALLSELACETPTPHLRIIGGLLRGELRDDPVHFVRQIAEQFPTLSADHVIVDCGSGRSPGTVAAFAEGTVGILVTTPEPAALESVYLFTEAHLRWCLVRALTGETMAALEARLRETGVDPARTSFRAFMTRVGAIDPAARDTVAAVLRRTRLELLLNLVRGDSDEEAAAALASGFRKCFGLSLHTAGIIEHDLSVLQAVQKRRSLSQQYPNASSTKGIARSGTRLLAVAVGPLREADEEWEDLETIDHYRVLEVVPKASPKEVQSAYQLLKRTYDPETTFLGPVIEAPGLREMQARIEAAYRTLIFLESRSTYDRQMLERGALRDDQIRGLHGGPATEPRVLERAGGEVVPTAAPPPGTDGGAASGPPPATRVQDEPNSASLQSPHAAQPPPTIQPSPVPAPVAWPAPSDLDASRPLPASGPDLRDERQRQRQALETIAEKTKIRPTHLQAIEEERFADLPASVFVRGFLKEYARCLGLPAEEVCRLYMKRHQDWHESHRRPTAPPGSRQGD
ncbi:MAG TPA: helix-turn-helix domain-containing protein [Candidatus Polarisedimenticolia bacterium]|nr:helix-turn-helix domain-containing protein [Candidatus Polarisedimenticolia bacterium]